MNKQLESRPAGMVDMKLDDVGHPVCKDIERLALKAYAI
jgi:hypothetical protein